MSSRQRYTAPPAWHPKLWLSWLGYGVLYLMAKLPFRNLWALGRGLGGLLRRLSKDRRHITERNIALCFPELSEAEQAELVESTFAHTGMAAMEAIWSWLGHKDQNPEYLARFDVSGLEHLQAAQATGRGIILIGEHLMTMDAVGPLVRDVMTLDVIYRYNKNPVIEHAMVKGRGRYFGRIIEREDTRSVIRSLKEGRAIWYAADQDYGAKHSVFARFFGVPAATITGTARLARLCQASVMPLRQYRHPDTGRWSLHFSPPLLDFPSDDPLADAQRINDSIEAAVREAPEQYLWLHRRFKTRPTGTPSVYD